jgi:predicted dienelactone hydrolase
VAVVGKNLSVPHEYRVVPNSHHFAFLTPCSPELTQKRPELCTDAPGFDRVALHEKFNAEVLAFFRAHFGDRNE